MTLVSPDDSLERQNEKLLQITRALMRRVEQGGDQSNIAYAQFERAALLEDQVRQRTRELEQALDLLHESNIRLAEANRETEAAQTNLTDAIETVREGFALFDQHEKLVLCNTRFCRDFHDIVAELKPGLDFERYVDLISHSPHLSLPEGEDAASWARKRKRRHRDTHVMFNVCLTMDRWIQVSEHRTHNGGTVIMQTDVTDIVRMERQERERLRDTQARMIRATLDHLNQGVCIFDGQRQLVGWNSRLGFLLNVPLVQLRLGLPFERFLDHFDGRLHLEETRDAEPLRDWAAKGTSRRPFSCEARRLDGRILDVFGQEMPDNGFVISFTDVTAEREAARALREVNEHLEQRVAERTLELEDALASAERANASKSRFVAAASHDLLQPLSAAKLFVSSLSGKGLSDDDQSLIGKTETALASVEEIIDALLDISKLESGKASFDIATVHLSDILVPLRHQLEPIAAAKGLELQVVDSALCVRSDPGYLRRIVQNLASNALRYTEKGKVLIGVRRNGGSARIEVWDTGPGIAEQDQRLIFEEFRRLNAKASASEGMGLGLAIVKRACAQLEHPLSLWSEPGQGSGFFVNVPMAPSSPRMPIRETATTGPDPRDLGLIVLLVENDPDVRRAITINIESWGVNVIDAESAEDALQLLEDIQIRPDALLLDYQLGEGMNGLDLYTIIRDKYGSPPARMISADRSPTFRRQCETAGVELLTKPLDEGKLRGFLQSVASEFQSVAE